MAKERPIIFSGPMIRAILDGRKAQTRRVIKPQPRTAQIKMWTWSPLINPRLAISEVGPRYPQHVICPYGQPGDRLWVRETWGEMYYTYGMERTESSRIVYRADEPVITHAFSGWKPSIHMPRWASRITLEVTGVRVERVRDISADDVVAEGYPNCLAADLGATEHFDQFIHLWDSINGKKYPWDSNPWVWVLDFRRVTP